ncbi:MAG TPA: hypothetical protein VNH18_08225 [Bryobacteraceae bacterium]|nr:hypothetical protein [Bryobacteraceae bacterium]
MGQVRTPECELIDIRLREIYPSGGVEIDCQKDTYSEDYIVWLTAGENVQPVRITIDEYADGDWLENMRLAIDLLKEQAQLSVESEG